jgi:hypothetical protein
VQRQVLGYLLFHERSPVVLRADAEACTRFLCPSTDRLAKILSAMAQADLFRVLPTPVAAADTARALRTAPAEGPARADEADFLRGVSVMITAEGKRRFTALKHRTRKVRQADWQEEQEKVEPGTWVRSDM